MSSSESIKNILEDLLTHLALPYTKSEYFFNADDGSYWFRIETTEQYFLGHTSDIIDALNILAHRILEENKELEKPLPFITIEINDFQKKRIENLRNLAHMMSERARFFKNSIDIDPMNPYERKIIHTFLEGRPNIKTESSGQGRDRHITIRYVEE